jgi:hypothetical protein
VLRFKLGNGPRNEILPALVVLGLGGEPLLISVIQRIMVKSPAIAACLMFSKCKLLLVSWPWALRSSSSTLANVKCWTFFAGEHVEACEKERGSGEKTKRCRKKYIILSRVTSNSARVPSTKGSAGMKQTKYIRTCWWWLLDGLLTGCY